MNDENTSHALRLLEAWQERDPGARKFSIRYHGPVKRTPLTWSRGYSVCLRSSRIRKINCPSTLHYSGQTLLQAAERALKAYAKYVR